VNSAELFVGPTKLLLQKNSTLVPKNVGVGT